MFIVSFAFILKLLIADKNELLVKVSSIFNYALYVLNKKTNLQELISVMKKMFNLFIIVPIENKEAIELLSYVKMKIVRLKIMKMPCNTFVQKKLMLI